LRELKIENWELKIVGALRARYFSMCARQRATTIFNFALRELPVRRT
jgi:hypothetical protein